MLPCTSYTYTVFVTRLVFKHFVLVQIELELKCAHEKCRNSPVCKSPFVLTWENSVQSARITGRRSDLRGLAAIVEKNTVLLNIDATIVFVWQMNAAESMFTKPCEEFTLLTGGYFTAFRVSDTIVKIEKKSLITCQFWDQVDAITSYWMDSYRIYL